MDLIDLRARISADGSSFEREMGRVAASSSKTSRVVREDADKSALSMEKMGAAGGRMHGALSGVAGYVGAAGVAYGLKDIVESGIQAQDRLTQLQGTMKNLGVYSKDAFESLTSGAESLSTHGGADYESQLSGLQRLLTVTGSVSEAQQANAAATNLARQAHIGYGQAIQVVSRGLTGSVGRLKQYVGIIEPVTTAQKALGEAHGLDLINIEKQSRAMGKAGPLWYQQQEYIHHVTSAQDAAAKAADAHATGLELLARVQQISAGAAQRYSQTTAGAASNLSNSFKLVKEQAGEGLLPVVRSVFGFLASHRTTVVVLALSLAALGVVIGTVKVAQASWNAVTAIGSAVMKVYGALTGTTTTVIEGATAATDGAALATGGLTAATEAQGAALLVTAGAADGAAASAGLLGVAEVDLSGASIAAAGSAGVLAVAMNAIPFVAIITAVGLLAILVVKNFAKIKHAVLDVVRWFKKNWKQALLLVLEGPFLALPIFAAKHIGALKSIVSGKHGVTHGFGLFSNGGIASAASATHVAHFATGGVAGGGLLGGYGGGDRIPAYLERGEGIMRKEAVASIGPMNFNAINATGKLPPSPAGEVYVSAPINLYMGQRVVTQEVVHFAARRQSLNGSLVLS